MTKCSMKFTMISEHCIGTLVCFSRLITGLIVNIYQAKFLSLKFTVELAPYCQGFPQPINI